MFEGMNTSILFILVFGIPIFGYIFIGKILAKSFNNTPDAPSYLEKSPPNFFVRFLKSILRIAIVIAVAVVIPHLQIGVFSDLMRFDNPEEQKIIDEYEELKENNIDPENGKTILTPAFLLKDYKIYYLGEQRGSDFATKMSKGIFIVLLITAGGTSGISYLFLFYKQKKKISILSILATLLLIPTITIAFRIIDNDIWGVKVPAPESAKISVVDVTINSRSEEVVHNEESSDSYYYYISIDYGDGKGPVSKETSYGIYYTAEMPGAYLMGQVDDNGNRIDFILYPTSEYEKEN